MPDPADLSDASNSIPFASVGRDGSAYVTLELGSLGWLSSLTEAVTERHSVTLIEACCVVEDG